MTQSTRYDRQLALPEIGIEGQHRLSEAKVVIIGVGGLGSPIALYLVGAGVGTVGLVDDDVVSVSNLQRQVLYSEAQQGQPKVLCAKKRLEQLNGDVTIVAHDTRLNSNNAADIIGIYDIVIDGTDNFATRFLISDVCETLRKPYIYGAINAFEGQVAVLCKGSATYRTLFPDERGMLAMPHPGKAVVGVTPAVVGSVEAGQAMQLICGYGEPLIDRLWTIDLRTMQSFVLEINH